MPHEQFSIMTDIENQTFSGLLEISLPENYPPVLLCYFGIHSNAYKMTLKNKVVLYSYSMAVLLWFVCHMYLFGGQSVTQFDE